MILTIGDNLYYSRYSNSFKNIGFRVLLVEQYTHIKYTVHDSSLINHYHD